MQFSEFLEEMFAIGDKPASQPNKKAAGYAITTFNNPSKVLAAGLSYTETWKRIGKNKNLVTWICTQNVIDNPTEKCILNKDYVLDLLEEEI